MPSRRHIHRRPAEPPRSPHERGRRRLAPRPGQRPSGRQAGSAGRGSQVSGRPASNRSFLPAGMVIRRRSAGAPRWRGRMTPDLVTERTHALDQPADGHRTPLISGGKVSVTKAILRF